MQLSQVPCGFVIERAQLYLPALRLVTHELDCVIVTVNYRLAPETWAPGSLEDNCPALQIA
jgi:acetyl esterase/lipase